MRKNKIFLWAASIILVMTGIIAGRTNPKYGSVTALYYLKGGVCTFLVNLNYSPHLTTVGVGCQMRATTINCTTLNLYATSNCVRRVFFVHP